jgi:hypothetical protein
MQTADAQNAGAGLAMVGQAATLIGERIRTREEAVNRVKAINGYSQEATAELDRLKTEGDLSDGKTLADYGNFLSRRQAELIDQFGGSEDSKIDLFGRLSGARTQLLREAGTIGTDVSRKRVVGYLGTTIQQFAGRALENPASLSSQFLALDNEIDKLSGALSPDEETAARMTGRQEITLGALNSLVASGNHAEARKLLDEQPSLLEIMTPLQQRAMNQNLESAEKAERETRLAGQREVNKAEQILNRRLTASERLKLAGVAPAKGEDTPEQKIAGLEAVLGPLSKDDKRRALGLYAPAQTTAGKVIEDRERFARVYGEDSPQVKAFDEAAAEPDTAKLGEIGGIRKEFTAQSKDFVTIRDSFNRVAASARDPSAAGDLALIFNYMKILDPGSVVRESEFATAQNAAGIPERLRSQYNRVLSGERLGDTQRTDFVNRARDLMKAQTNSQLALESEYRGIAQRAGIKEQDVVVDYIGPMRAPDGGSSGAGARLQYDLQGNPVGEQ